VVGAPIPVGAFPGLFELAVPDRTLAYLINTIDLGALGLIYPSGITFNPSTNTLFIVDNGGGSGGGGPNDRMAEVSLEGNLLHVFDLCYDGLSSGIAYDPTTRTFLISDALGWLHLVTPSGTLLSSLNLVTLGILQPGDIAIDPNSGVIFIADGPSRKVIKLTMTAELTALGSATLWIGLKNSDDQGTAFDLEAEVAIGSVPVATARTLCIAGVTRNPDKAKKAVIQFEPFLPVSVAPDAVFSLTIRTRIGTNPNGTKCAGHSNAVGLRLYYDSTSQSSRIGAQLTPEPLRDFFLHSGSSNALFLDESDPTATTAKFKDSAGVNFAGGNPWRAVGTWSMTLP
jgi:hypothetical protein